MSLTSSRSRKPNTVNLLSNRRARERAARGKPLTVPCTVPDCEECFATKAGLANHLRREHNVLGQRRKDESQEEMDRRLAAIKKLVPFAAPGGNMDSEKLWSLLFTAPKKAA